MSYRHLNMEAYTVANWQGSEIDERVNYNILYAYWRKFWSHGRIKDHQSLRGQVRGWILSYGSWVFCPVVAEDIVIRIKGDRWLYTETMPALYIAKNPMCHEQTKNVKVDCHSIKQRICKDTPMKGFLYALFWVVSSFSIMKYYCYWSKKERKK